MFSSWEFFLVFSSCEMFLVFSSGELFLVFSSYKIFSVVSSFSHCENQTISNTCALYSVAEDYFMLIVSQTVRSYKKNKKKWTKLVRAPIRKIQYAHLNTMKIETKQLLLLYKILFVYNNTIPFQLLHKQRPSTFRRRHTEGSLRVSHHRWSSMIIDNHRWSL